MLLCHGARVRAGLQRGSKGSVIASSRKKPDNVGPAKATIFLVSDC